MLLEKIDEIKDIIMIKNEKNDKEKKRDYYL